MQDGQELRTETKLGTLRYKAPTHDKGAFRLMNTISSSEREVVRVLRSCKLNSCKAPIGGLRYDGLYRVTSYGISLSSSKSLPSAQESWNYNFTLQREPDQDSLDKALAHPIAEELDDWKDYQRVKAAERGKAKHKESRRKELKEKKEAILSLNEVIGESRSEDLEGSIVMQRSLTGDSGYFSRTGTKVSRKTTKD